MESRDAAASSYTCACAHPNRERELVKLKFEDFYDLMSSKIIQ